MTISHTRESYLDKIYQSIQNTLLTNTDGIIRTKSIKLTLDNDDLVNFFQEESSFVITNLTLKLENMIKEFNLPIEAGDLSIIIDTSYFPQQRFRDLKGRTAYKIVNLNAVIIGEDKIKFYMKKKAFACTTCGSENKRVSEDDERKPPICVICKKPTELILEKCQFGEVKSIIIREDFEDANDKQPIEYLSKIKDSFIHKFSIGQKINLIGVRKAIQEPKKEEFHIEIDILSAEGLDDPKEAMPTDEEIANFKINSKLPDFEEKLIQSFAPDVHCVKDSILWNVKKSFLLILATGKKLDRKRQFIHMLLLGDPGTAKTTMMKFAASISPHSLYVAGNSSSKAGLTAIIEKQLDGRYIVKAGVLPLCNNGFCMVDEFNLMEPEDQNGLQEAMENQQVTKAKAALAQFPAKCGIVGGANPIFGKYDEDRTVLENIEISVPLLSRFDLKWCLLDIPEKNLDTAVSKHLLTYYKNSNTVDTDAPLSKDQMRKFFNYIRSLEPEITTDAENAIVKFVNKARSLNNDQKAMPIDKRVIETTIRLSIAKAKLQMKDFVEEADVKDITTLYLRSLESFGIDTKNELTQNKFFDTHETNQLHTFWQMFGESMDMEQSVDKVELIDKLASTKLFDEYRAKMFFEKQISANKLYEIKSGRWKKVD